MVDRRSTSVYDLETRSHDDEQIRNHGRRDRGISHPRRPRYTHRDRLELKAIANVYAYGGVDGVMTEETPFNPTELARSVRGR
jgi:hypothetical protein